MTIGMPNFIQLSRLCDRADWHLLLNNNADVNVIDKYLTWLRYSI